MDMYIPKKIKVGFQNRDGTYTKRLAYIIYQDDKNVLRKEKSWQKWRDSKIEPEDYDNEPTEGFVLNKGVQRYGWSHFSSNRSMIRVYDPRGLEFEITPENLIGILMETTCSKRCLEGKFVYAWSGTELALLPCGSEAYQTAMSYTDLQAKDISAKDLKLGCSYTAKSGNEVIYLGFHKWYKWSNYAKTPRTSKKMHIFAHPQKPKYGSILIPKSDVSFLAVLNNPEPVQNFAELFEIFTGDIRSSKIVRWGFTPVNPIIEKKTQTVGGTPGNALKQEVTYEVLTRKTYAELQGDNLIFWNLELVAKWNKDTLQSDMLGYHLIRTGIFCTKTLQATMDHSTYYNSSPLLTEQEVVDRLRHFVDAYIVLESGKTVPFKSIHSCGEY